MSGPFPFPTRYHRDVIAAGAVHSTDFYSVTDPVLDVANSVSPGKRWRRVDDLDNPTWFEIYVRNEANDGWIKEQAWVIADFLPGQVPVADADGRLAPGDIDSDFQGGGGGGPHASTHYDAGSDEVDITQLGGFPGGTDDFLRADGSFATPPGGSGVGTDGGVVAPAAIGAHRYWRFDIAWTSTGGIGFSELRPKLSGSTVTPTTASAYSTIAGAVANLYDSDMDTLWVGTGLPGWVKYDFGSAQALDQIVLRQRNDAFWADGRTWGIAVFTSPDDTNWTRRATLLQGLSGSNVEETFNLP